MKKLLLLLVSAPFATTSCLVQADDTTPDTPDNGTGGGDQGSDDTTPDPEPEPDPEDTYRAVMSEVEIEDYLSERSFAIIASDGTHSGTGMGSGWLMDESEDNWYIATNRHVTEALDNGDGTVMITNDWDRMWQDYNIRDWTYNVDANGSLFDTDSEAVSNPQTTAEIHFLFSELRTTADVGEIVYEAAHPTSGGVDYYDFAVVKVPKVTSMIDPLVEPIEVATQDMVRDLYGDIYGNYWIQGYSFANGNYRYGSFFKDSYVNVVQNASAKAWSPSVAYDPPGVETYSNWGFDNGPGSSGSAMIDERGYFIMNNTFGYSNAWPLSINEAYGQKKYHHSGVSGKAMYDVVLPDYLPHLSEKTLLNPNG